MTTEEVKRLVVIVDCPAFGMYEAGMKPEEYRGTSAYWAIRLMENVRDPGGGASFIKGLEVFKKFDIVEFRCGYTKRAIQFEHLGTEIGLPNPEYIPKSKTKYGFDPNEEVFIIKLGKRI